jgi:hypothetical protein
MVVAWVNTARVSPKMGWRKPALQARPEQAPSAVAPLVLVPRPQARWVLHTVAEPALVSHALARLDAAWACM